MKESIKSNEPEELSHLIFKSKQFNSVIWVPFALGRPNGPTLIFLYWNILLWPFHQTRTDKNKSSFWTIWKVIYADKRSVIIIFKYRILADFSLVHLSNGHSSRRTMEQWRLFVMKLVFSLYLVRIGVMKFMECWHAHNELGGNPQTANRTRTFPSCFPKCC